MSNFVHLHNHSDYSLLDGACRIGDYVSKASKLGMKHIGLTDHGNLFGALKFEQACHKANINPVVGSEVYVAPGSRFKKPKEGYKNFHMVLYAKNEQGYRNLMLLTTKGYTEGFYYKPRIDDELLEQYHEGLMASSACLAGEIPRAILGGNMEEAKRKALYYQNLFGEGNYWLEVMNHGMEEEEIVRRGIRQLGEETGIPIIATNDIHFLEKDHANAHDILICISTGKVQSDTKRLKTENPEFYFKTDEQMRDLFPDFPDAIENTVKLAEKCDLTIPQPGPQLPYYTIPEDFASPEIYLEHLTKQGLQVRYPEEFESKDSSDKWNNLVERTDYELQVIFKMNYAGYFLIVWDFIDWARRQGISVGPGRGSGAGSIVAYALKITDVDPIKYKLLFERFLNPERISMPDFDIDFCFERRGEVIDYVRNKYGEENVSGICTFGTLKTKAVLKDVARVLDMPFSESNAITALIPEVKPPEKIDVRQALDKVPSLLNFYERGGIYKTLFDTSMILEGMNRHVSTHACGIIIGRSTLTDYIPLYKDQKTGDTISAYSMDIIESCGLVKMDFLGLKTLTLLQNCEKLIQKNFPDFDMEKIPEYDKATFDMLSEGHSEAVFQFESPGMQKNLRAAKPDSLEDLIALNALYRPGPMDNIPTFIQAKKNPEKIDYHHPDLEEVLKATYGVIVYQEQVMEVAQIIGGFNLGKADILRRAMGKKKEAEMARMEVEFLDGARKKGYSENLARKIYELLKPFASYGFNRSHAVAYAILGYKTAYCKVKYPAEFWASNLTNEIKETDTLKKYLGFARSSGVPIMPPDINLSEKVFTVSEGKIIYGLMGIKGMGEAAAEAIIKARMERGEFTGFIDFLEKVDLKTLNRKVLETTIKAGLFDSSESHNRPTLLKNLETTLKRVQKKKDYEVIGQPSLFDDEEEAIEIGFQWQIEEDWPDIDKLRAEKEIIGFYVSGHPVEKHKDIKDHCTTVKLNAIDQISSQKKHTVLGMLKNIRTFQTKKGDTMASAELEDEQGSIKLTLFSRIYEKFGYMLEEEAIVGITGQFELDRDVPQIKVSEVKRPEDLKEIVSVPDIHVELIDCDMNEETVIDLRSFFQDMPGPANLFLHVTENGHKSLIQASPQLNLAVDDSTLKTIRSNALVNDAWKE